MNNGDNCWMNHEKGNHKWYCPVWLRRERRNRTFQSGILHNLVKMNKTLNSTVPNTAVIENSWFSFKFSDRRNKGNKEKKGKEKKPGDRGVVMLGKKRKSKGELMRSWIPL